MSPETRQSTNPSSQDMLLYSIEQTLIDPSSGEIDPTFAKDLIAQKGRPGLVSLYAECLQTIDVLPKRLSPKRMSLTALSEPAKELLLRVDQSIELNPLFDRGTYTLAKQLFDYWGYKEPTEEFLTDRKYQSSFPEHSLAALHNAVQAGFSKRKPQLRAWQSQTPSKLLQTMRLNGSIDEEVMDALAIARGESSCTTQEHVDTLISLANGASLEIQNIRQGKSRFPLERNSNSSNLSRRSIKEELKIMGTTGASTAAIGETTLLIITGHPSISRAACAFIGAVGTMALHKILAK